MPTIAPLCLRRATFVLGFALLLLVAKTARADSITLTWDPSGGTAPAGYAVYVTQQGGTAQRHDVGQSTAFTITNAVAGQQYCFAVASYSLTIEGPRSGEICGYTNQFPSLTNPGNRTSTVGQSATLQLTGSDPDGQPLTYLASGMPPGLLLMAATGFISGTPTTAGNYAVTATVSDGVLTSAPQSFTWTISASSTSDRTSPTISISGPTSASSYSSYASAITLSGTAADNVGVSTVTWQNSRGGSGTADGAASWSVGFVGLQLGSNVITVTARDAAGNVGTDVLTVTRNAPDATAPTIAISTPTTAPTMTTMQPSLTLGGTASDNVGVTQVSWVNNRGGSGTATGTTSWSAPGVTLQSGTNVVTVTARDAAGNQGVATLTVTYGGQDTTAPTVNIVGPTTAPTYTTTSSVITIGGTASDDRGVTAVTWVNDRGGSGFTSGTTTWSVASVTLRNGVNVITVTAEDAAHNRGTDVLTVTYDSNGSIAKSRPRPR